MSTTKRGGWWKSPRTLLRTILQLDDTPHSIALGTAVGMWIGLTPTVGLQMGLVMLFVFLTRPLFRFNVMAAIVTVYISNPITMIPLYWFNYEVGSLFIEGIVSKEQFKGVLKSDQMRDSWTAAVTLMKDLGWPLILGSLIVATVFSLMTYPSMLALLHWYRRSNPETLTETETATNAVPASPILHEKASLPISDRDETAACVSDARTTTIASIATLCKSDSYR